MGRIPVRVLFRVRGAVLDGCVTFLCFAMDDGGCGYYRGLNDQNRVLIGWLY